MYNTPMTRLLIQIPCLNEEETLGIALEAIPRSYDGVDHVELLVIDDGSTDRTVDVARRYGVHHVVSLSSNKGLARAFMAGLEYGLKIGADIIVNTDADNQYQAEDIQLLINPILEKKAEIVIGERPIQTTAHFSPLKKVLQRFGSFMVQKASRTKIPDAPSGFRAISRDAALRLNIFNEYTYTLEMIIQAGKSRMNIMSVPIRTNDDLRPSRLVKSIPFYIRQAIFTMFRVLNTYQPLQVFLLLGGIPFTLGVLLGLRWVILFMGEPASHIPSLILAAILILIGGQLFIFGLAADLVSVNRKLLEDIQFRLRQMDQSDPS